MKEVIRDAVRKEHKLKQKVRKEKYYEDGKLKKVIERETDYADSMPVMDTEKES